MRLLTQDSVRKNVKYHYYLVLQMRRLSLREVNSCLSHTAENRLRPWSNLGNLTPEFVPDGQFQKMTLHCPFSLPDSLNSGTMDLRSSDN